MEECLWVKDTIAKNARSGSNQDPEVVRCRKDGKIFCVPCGVKFFGPDWPQSEEDRIRDDILRTVAVLPSSMEPYTISRDLLARIVAAHTSGMYNAIPEQADFDNADAMIALLEKNLRE